MQWARDVFEGAFTKSAENAAQFLEDPLFLDRITKLAGVQPLEVLDQIKVKMQLQEQVFPINSNNVCVCFLSDIKGYID